MARKNKNKKRQQAGYRKNNPPKDLEQQQAHWRSMWTTDQEHGDRTDTKKLVRPSGSCPKCKTAFMRTDAFHYTPIGPIHGWGKFEDMDTCRLRERTTNTKAPHNQCLECKGTIFKGEEAHNVAGGRIHGPGKYHDTGTCIYRHREDIVHELKTLCTGFLDGTISEADIEELIPKMQAREAAMGERIAPPTKRYSAR